LQRQRSRDAAHAERVKHDERTRKRTLQNDIAFLGRKHVVSLLEDPPARCTRMNTRGHSMCGLTHVSRSQGHLNDENAAFAHHVARADLSFVRTHGVARNRESQTQP